MGSKPDAAASAPVTPGSAGASAISKRDHEILQFEHRWWRHPAAKEEAIRTEFGLSATRYYQLLDHLLDAPAALAHDPVLVNRLRRLRDTRAAERAAGPLVGADSGPAGIRR